MKLTEADRSRGMAAITQLLTVDEVAAMLRMSARRARRLVKQGHIPTVALPNGEIRFDSAAIQEWISRLSRPGDTKVSEAAR